MSEQGTWHAYDVSTDAWGDLPEPPRPIDLHSHAVSATGGTVVALARRSRHVLTLDLGRRTWRTLPPSPHRPRLDLHHAIATPEGIVAIGTDASELDDGRGPSYLMAEVHRDGAWDRLPPSEMVGGYFWHWTGERLLAPVATCVDGGDVDGYGRCVPEGGVLDPGRRAWEPLPTLREDAGPGWGLSGAHGPRVLLGGRLYDDADGSLAVLGAPQGAARFAGTTAVVTDDAVIAFGGIDWRAGSGAGETTGRAWLWAP